MVVLAPVVSLLGIFGTLLIGSPTSKDVDPTLITTAYGPVRGRLVFGARNTRFYSFQGIPYARPPIGKLRFKDPQLPEIWTKPLEARYEGATAPGLDIFGGNTIDPFASEDCLRLNVFTRHPISVRKFPVMVFIHGGGYIAGSSSQLMYGADLLMQKDVVLVTFNYRLGALGKAVYGFGGHCDKTYKSNLLEGFLSVSNKNYNIPGNAGLKDQAYALLWVRHNIARFGGDPDNVTLFGNSAGASSVHYHMMSDYSKGLFHKAILESGVAFNPWANYAGTDLNERLASKLGWNGVGGIREIMKTLMAASAEEIVYAQQQVSIVESQRGDLFLFVPRVEPYNNGSCFIPRKLELMNKKSWGSSIPILIGANSHEGYLNFFDFIKKARVLEDPSTYFQNAIPKELMVDTDQRKEFGSSLQTFYFGNETPSETNIEDKLVPLLSDKLFWHGINGVIQSRLNNPKSSATYLYRFSFDSKILFMLELVLAGRFVKGTVHSEELQYLFNFSGINAYMPEGTDEAKVRNTFLNVWTHFAATGNPNCPAISPIIWEPVKNNSTHMCLNIDAKNSFIVLPESKRIAFWNSLYKFA